MKPRVAVVRTDIGVKEAAQKAVELLGGIEAFVEPGETALLKPNIFTVKDPAAPPPT